MDSDKKATIQNAFTVEAYQVLEDGSHKALELSEGLNFTVHTGNDLTGKTVVVAVQGKDAVEYVEGSVKGEDVTFTVKEASAFAVGAVAAQNNNNNGGDNNKNNSNINNGNTNNNSANKSNSAATNKIMETPVAHPEATRVQEAQMLQIIQQKVQPVLLQAAVQVFRKPEMKFRLRQPKWQS